MRHAMKVHGVPDAIKRLWSFPAIRFNNCLPRIDDVLTKEEQTKVSPEVIKQVNNLYTQVRTIRDDYVAQITTVVMVAQPLNDKPNSTGEMAVI